MPDFWPVCVYVIASMAYGRDAVDAITGRRVKTGLRRVPRVDGAGPLVVAAVPAVRRRRQDAVVDVEHLQESFLVEQITAVLVVEDHRAHTSVVREP